MEYTNQRGTNLDFMREKFHLSNGEIVKLIKFIDKNRNGSDISFFEAVINTVELNNRQKVAVSYMSGIFEGEERQKEINDIKMSIGDTIEGINGHTKEIDIEEIDYKINLVMIEFLKRNAVDKEISSEVEKALRRLAYEFTGII